jgi:hypothetical protein
MFTTIINNFRFSQVAVVVQNLLEINGQGSALSRNAASIANKLVAQTHAENPPMFEGRMGARPHKLTFAAAALAKGLVKPDLDRETQLSLKMALGTVLLEITGKPTKYRLTSIDHALLEIAQGVYLAVP